MILAEKYEVVEQIGQGGMGVVYRVRHLDLDTTLALKVLPKELAGDAELVDRFRLEARLMARLDHRNIVRVHDFTRDGDSYYLIMEYLHGRNLRQYLQDHLDVEQRPLPLGEVLRLGVQIARALAFAHGQSPPVVHRDIKPSNVVVEEHTGRAVVMDFGIAKVLGDAGVDMTRTGVFVGTVKYCSPEQMRRDKDIDGSADVYSLGLVLYELYTGRQFFSGLTEQEVIARVLSGGEEDLSALTAAHPSFGPMVARAVARDRSRRYASAEQFLADLAALRKTLAAEEGGAPAEPADEAADDDEPFTPVVRRPAGRRDGPEGPVSSVSWFSPNAAATVKPVEGGARAGFDTSTGHAIPRRAAPLSRRVGAATRWLRERWWAIAAVVPALVVAVVCVVEGLAWIGRPFPGFFIMENAVIPPAAAFHWTGMAARVPFNSAVLRVDGEPLDEANDLYERVAALPVGTEVAYTLAKDGATFERQVPTMRFTALDYALTLGLFSVNGLVILLAGIVVGVLTPANRSARVFLAMSVMMGLLPLTAVDLYRGHRFTALHLGIFQCVTPATLIHLALVFPVERRIGGLGRVLVWVPYLVGTALGVVLVRGFWAEPADLRALYGAFAFSGLSLLVLIGSSLHAFWQHRAALVRGRVQVVMIGAVAGFLLPIVGFVDNSLGGGRLPSTLIAVTPILFFIGVGYAIVKHKLFDAQLIIRRSVVYGALLAGFTALYVLVIGLMNVGPLDPALARSPAFTGSFLALSLAAALPLRDRLSALIDAQLFPRKHRLHRTIHEISSAISAMVDLDAVLAKVLHALTTGMEVSSAAVLLRAETGGGFRQSAAVGTAPSDYELDERSPVAQLLATTQGELFADDLREDPELAGMREEGRAVFAALDAELLIPLMSDTGMIGVLALGRSEAGHTITSEDIQVLHSLGGAIGLAVVRARDAAGAARMALHRQVLERYLPATSLRNALGRDVATPAGRRVRVTVVAVRLRRLRAFADGVVPEAMMQLMRDYYTLCDDLTQQAEGTAEQYDGGRVIMVFGAPEELADQATRAARTALAIRGALEQRREAWAQQGYTLAYGCGIARGLASVGFVDRGSQGGYTVLGEAVELATGLADAAESGTILAPSDLVSELGPGVRGRDLGARAVGPAAAELPVSALEGEAA